MIHDGNSLEVLKQFDENSIDACVCDPPYELGFMGKSWDSTGIAYNVELWREVFRVLKPGGHLLAFGGSRTFHRLACAIEDAGFEIRDQLLWIYGSGFPKSLDVSKAIDKQEGHERNTEEHTRIDTGFRFQSGGTTSLPPQTPAAIQWNGWGTALKPAHEPICMARKPFKSTVADNVLQWGTGAINVDAGRLGVDEKDVSITEKRYGYKAGRNHVMKQNEDAKYEHLSGLRNISHNSMEWVNLGGRWPSNVLLSETAAQDLDDSVGILKSGKWTGQKTGEWGKHLGALGMKSREFFFEGSSGGPSRFFYVAKASKREREAGLEGFDVVRSGAMEGNVDGSMNGGVPIMRSNHHPTVKPIKLMEYLVKLVTPPGGIVLDPFTGSGSTGCACARLGFEFQGIELSPQYAAIAEARIKWFAMNELDLDELDRSENAKADTQGVLF